MLSALPASLPLALPLLALPLVRQWGLMELEGLDADGEQARQELAAAVAVLDEQATRFVERREEAAAKRAARTG